MGARFTVRLPVPQVEAQAEERAAPAHEVAGSVPAAAAEPVSLAGMRVLIVDDDADARELVRVVLSNSGAEVSSASTSDEALQLMTRQVPDVLVSDVGLPGEDGYALIRRVRGQPQ